MDAWVVFAKEPEPGQVKTRLTPPVPPEVAAALYTAFVEDVCAKVAAMSEPGDRRVLAAPGGAGPVLERIAREHGFETASQEGADLGGRMGHALGAELARGARGVVLVGSDSPTLPPSLLREARARLADAGDGPRAVIGPSGDGGYWLVGAAGAVPDLFDGVPWSTRDVLAATLERARARGVVVSLLPFWHDIDDATDLRLLAAWIALSGAETAPRTAAAVAALRARNPAIFRGEPPV